jgi:hypothetical protein
VRSPGARHWSSARLQGTRRWFVWRGDVRTRTLQFGGNAVHVKFVKIIGCEKCDRSTCSQLLRDSWENDPQAGYVGTNYERTGRGSGRSQACPAGSPRKTGHIRQRSEPYETTRRHRTMPSRMTSWADLYPTGRSTDATFPLAECGLTLGDITYFNLVRCRTIHNGPQTLH